MPTQQYIFLYEYDRPITQAHWLNYCAGVWFLVLSPGAVVVTDDNANTGYYSYANVTEYMVRSFRADGIYYSKTDTLTDCIATDSSFFYDTTTTRLYVHFEDGNPYYGKNTFFGAAIGFMLGDNDTYDFNGFYYEPIVEKIFSIKREKDPIFYGLLKFLSGSVTLINSEGTFDDWRSRNLFAQTSRILVGHYGDSYDDLDIIFTGSIGQTSRNWQTMSIQNEDIRKRLTQPVARNLLTLADYPNLNESNVDSPKPVVYGEINNAPCICLNENETASTYTFLLCDTEYNIVSSLDEVIGLDVDGDPVDLTASAVLNAAAGTFTLTDAVYVPGDNVTASFTMAISNGVEIIKDIVSNYDKKPYLASFWNLTEVAAAALLSRDTSLYIDDDTDVKTCLEKVCSDIDAILFPEDDGKYSIRIYDEDRAISRILFADDWLGEPNIQDNQEQFLTSVIIKYNQNIDTGEFLQHENKDYEDAAYEIYKTYKNKVIETNLTTLADAIEKSETILDYSADVKDIITRSVPFENDSESFLTIQIMDFILCSPETRVSETENFGVYEVLGINRNPDSSPPEILLTLRLVRDSDFDGTFARYDYARYGIDKYTSEDAI